MLLGNTSKGEENLCPHKNLHTNVYSNFTYNCQNLKAIKMSFSKWTVFTKTMGYCSALKRTITMMPFNHLIFCLTLFLLPSIFPSIRTFFNESVLHVRFLSPDFRWKVYAYHPTHLREGGNRALARNQPHKILPSLSTVLNLFISSLWTFEPARSTS